MNVLTASDVGPQSFTIPELGHINSPVADFNCQPLTIPSLDSDASGLNDQPFTISELSHDNILGAVVTLLPSILDVSVSVSGLNSGHLPAPDLDPKSGAAQQMVNLPNQTDPKVGVFADKEPQSFITPGDIHSNGLDPRSMAFHMPVDADIDPKTATDTDPQSFGTLGDCNSGTATGLGRTAMSADAAHVADDDPRLRASPEPAHHNSVGGSHGTLSKPGDSDVNSEAITVIPSQSSATDIVESKSALALVIDAGNDRSLDRAISSGQVLVLDDSAKTSTKKQKKKSAAELSDLAYTSGTTLFITH